MSGTAQTALRRGQDFLRIGNKVEARRWLDRAFRLAPEDASVRLLLASALAGVDEGRCRALLLNLIADYPAFREARVALSAAELRAGANEAAAQHLSDLLRSSTPPDNAGFRQLADQIALVLKAPGWIGIDGRGQAVLSLLPSRVPTTLELHLDDRLIRSFRHDGSAHLQIRHTLPARWKNARVLSAQIDGRALLGSGIELPALRRVQGFVQTDDDGGLSGWAWHPADPETAAFLTMIPLDDKTREADVVVQRIRANDESFQTSSEDGPARLRGFTVPARRIPPAIGLRVVGPDGADLLGSPIYPQAEQRAARAAAAALRDNDNKPRPGPPDRWRPLAALWVADPLPRSRPVPPRRNVDVVMPVYRGVEDFTACLSSLRRQWPDWARLVVVDDASPDPALRAELAARSKAREFILLRHERNLGFPAAANTGLRHASARARAPRDVVLLNPDTLLPPGWLQRLVAPGYATGDTGSVTPLTNQGTIVSYPLPNADNESPDLAGTDRLDAVIRAANGRGRLALPTAVGFCMFIRHDCLAEVGLFREDAFAQGYGEENDWSLRANHLGWRHFAATGLFVAHLGGRSFGPGRRHLLARNSQVLNRLHPGYDAMVAAFSARDPLWPARFRADARRWAPNTPGQRAVILITHDAGGGVARFVAERCEQLSAEGRRPIVLRPVVPKPHEPNTGPMPSVAPADKLGCRVFDGCADEYPNLRFHLPEELDDLTAFLQADDPEAVEFHHLLGHAAEIMTLAARLKLPYRVFIHDYSYWCPRITLCTKGPRYCGEPLDTRECDACVMDAGRRIGIDMQVGQLRVASTHFLKQAESVLVSCEEVAERMARHFRGLRTTITPWEDDALLKQASRLAARPVQRRGPRRVLIVGAIGADKGYDVLLGCVRDAARRQLNLAFTVVGYTMDDARLIDSGPIFITGAFDEAEAISLAAAQRADIGFIPSIWPETWCYTLSTIWRVGLSAVAFAFGAQAQRISRTGLGILLPVGLASERINDALLEYATAQQDPLRPASDPADNDAPVAGLHRKEDRENESEWPLLA